MKKTILLSILFLCFANIFAQTPVLKTLTPTEYLYLGTNYFNGTINPQGHSYTVYFEYGTDETYGNVTPEKTVSGTEQVSVYEVNPVFNFLSSYSGDIYNLTIHHRLVAVASNGNKFYGRDVAFPVNHFYNPAKTKIKTVCSDHAANANFELTNPSPKSVTLGYSSIDIEGDVNLIPNIVNSIVLYKYSVCTFYYNNELFKQIKPNNQYCNENPTPEWLIFGYAVGTINNGTGAVYQIFNGNSTDVNLDLFCGTSSINITVSANSSKTVITTLYDMEIDYNGDIIMIISAPNYEYGKMSLSKVVPLCNDATTATFEIQNNDEMSHEFILKNAGGTEYLYSLAANSYQTVTLPKTNYDVYISYNLVTNMGYTPAIGNHYKMYSVSPGNIEFNVSNNTFTLNHLASANTLAVTSSIPWTAQSNQSWLTLNKTSGNGNDELIFNVSQNYGQSNRSATITLTNGCSVQTVEVTQEYVPNISLSFDGINDYVTLGDNDGMSAVTIETWIYYQQDGLQFVSSKGSEHLEIHTNTGGNLRFIPVASVYIDATNVLSVNQWAHIACVYDPSISLAKIYINGKEVPVVKNGAGLLTTPIANNTTNFFMGTRSGTLYPYKGNFDEFRIWNVARNAQEIADNFAVAINPATETNLVSYYNFNQGTAGGDNTSITSLTDLKGSFNGTFNNFALNGATSNFVGSYAMVVPVANAATNNTTTSFTANWTAPAIGTVNNYLLTVAADSNFTNQIAGYNPLTVDATTFSATVSGLTLGNRYYYRVAAQNTALSMISANSNTIEVSFGTSVSPNSFILRQAGESKNCQIYSDRNWTAVSSQTWLTLSQTNGNGNYTLVLTAPENNTGGTRNATITISTANQTDIIINVTQASITGTGTDENPYKIYSYTDLCLIDNINYPFSAVYRIMNDIDASASQTQNNGEGFIPIGNNTVKFTGKLHGGGHTISNLYINRPATDYMGLFGYAQNSIIDSVNIENINIHGKTYLGGISGYSAYTNFSYCNISGTINGYNNAGGIVGRMYNYCNINFCTFAGDIDGGSSGGIAGFSKLGKITNCNTKGNIYNGQNSGGLVGYSNLDTIINCYSYSNIYSNGYGAGGFAGNNDGSVISYCYSTGDIYSNNNGKGGFIGSNRGNITNCYSTGDVNGVNNTGGFIGWNNCPEITNCYSTGNVSGTSYVGGFVGDKSSGGTITSCYSAGSVVGNSYTGGFTGYNHYIIANSFFNYQTAGITNFAGMNTGTLTGCAGYNTSEMLQQTNFTGFNFTDNWQILENQTYPALQNINNAPFAFSDTISKHSLIFSFTELLANDYDYETLQTALCLKIDSVEFGTFDDENIYISIQHPLNIQRTVIYRVGEIVSAGDTLWGNRTKSLLMVTNSAPVIDSFSNSTINEDIPLTFTSGNISFTDTENDQLEEVSITEGDNYTVSGNTITPAQNFYGVIYVPVKIFDGFEWSETVIDTITVLPVNDAIVISDFTITQTNEDVAFTITDEIIEYSDVENDTIVDIFVNAGNNYSVAGTLVTPALNYFGTISVPVKVYDGTDWSEFYNMEVVVNSVNDAPVAYDTISTTRQNQPDTIPVQFSDVDGTVTNIYIETMPQHGSVSISGNEMIYIPNSTYFGTDQIQWFAKDNTGAFSNIATISITITQNTAPEITSTAPATATVGVQYIYNVVAVDAENDELTYSLSNAPTGMQISDNIITWTPQQGTTSSGNVTLTVSDGLLQDTEIFTISVSTVGISDLSENRITVYPNPTDGKLRVNSEKLKVKNVVVTDIMGKIVNCQLLIVNYQLEIDLSALNSGIYFLKIETETGVYTEKVIKE